MNKIEIQNLAVRVGSRYVMPCKFFSSGDQECTRQLQIQQHLHVLNVVRCKVEHAENQWGLELRTTADGPKQEQNTEVG